MRKFGVLCLALATVLTTTACASPAKIVKSIVGKSTSTNLLTNLPGQNGPILAVKIDDTPDAHPQVGLGQADVIYIEQVEGGLTRLAAIYSNKLPKTVGPIRSARISDLDILAQFGKVGFAFSGAQRKLLPKISEANLYNLSAEVEPPSIYYRDTTRLEPTNMFLYPSVLLEKSIQVEGKKIDTVKSVGWSFGKAPDTGTVIASAKLHWPSSRYEVIWSKEQKRWLLNFSGSPDVDETGMQLGSPTFLIQKVSITDSEYHDKVGGITPFSNTVGSGTGYILRDGKAIAAKWNRPDTSSGTSWTLSDGSNVNFATGQIWIALIDKDPVFTLPSPVPTKSK
jgi:hypothetical protein